MKMQIEIRKWTGRDLYGPAVINDEGAVVSGPYLPGAQVNVTPAAQLQTWSVEGYKPQFQSWGWVVDVTLDGKRDRSFL